MITLDEIIPYQPPTQFPTKPSQPFELTSSLLQRLPPLTHPLPQRPNLPITAPKLTDDLDQVHHDWNSPSVKDRGMSPQANAFDRELATLDMAEPDNAILATVNQNGRENWPGSNGSGLSTREHIIPCNDIPDNIENGRVSRHATPGDKGLVDMPSKVMEIERTAEAGRESDNNGLDVSSSSSQIENVSATENGELQCVPTIVCDTRRASVAMDDPDHAAASHGDLNQRADLLHEPSLRMHTRLTGPAVGTPAVGYNSLGHVNSTQPVSEMEIPADPAACEAVHEIADTGLVMQNDDHGDQTLCRSIPTVAPMNPHRIQEQSTSTQNEQSDSYSNCPVKVIMPTPQPAESQGSRTARRPHQKGGGRRKNRSISPQHVDSDDTDDDDYVDASTIRDDSRRPIKRTRQLPAAEGDRPEPQTAARSPLEGFSLPNLHAISRGVLTCEFFPSEIMYSFSWKEDRHLPDLRCRENPIGPTDQRCNERRKNDAQSSVVPRISHKANRTNMPFSKEELDLLKRLKEEDGLPWKQIKAHFPGRTEGALQVQYSTKLKDRDPKTSTAQMEREDLDARSSPLPELGRRNSAEHSPRAATELTFRSRYGPPRSRRAVDRYSPL